MLTRALLMLALAGSLAACGAPTAEQAVATAATKMNGLNNDKLDSAHAEGRTLVMRYKPIPIGAFSDDELVRLTSAGLCTLDGVKKMFDTGARLRLEIPRGSDFVRIEIDGCNGNQAIAATVADPAAPPAAKSGGWPTGAPIEKQ